MHLTPSFLHDQLSALRDKWGEALARRKEHLDEQIQKIINKADKTEEDKEREQALIDQWVSLTEERNAVKCPSINSGELLPRFLNTTKCYL